MFSDPDPIRPYPLCVGDLAAFSCQADPTKVPSRGSLHVAGSMIEADSTAYRMDYEVRLRYVLDALDGIDTPCFRGSLCKE